MKKAHIAIGISSLLLSRGGTERAAVYLSDAMTRRGHRVTLFYLPLPRNRPEPAYAVNPHCPVLRGPTGRHSDIQTMRELLLALETDVFLSMQSDAAHLLWAVSVLGTGIPFICSERTHPLRIENHFWNRPGRHAVLSGADFVHALLPEYALTVPDHWRHKVRVIGNSAPADAVPRAAPAGRPGRRKRLLFLARFIALKAPDLLVRAFALLRDEFPDWDLDMWGHGPLEEPVRALVNKLGLAGRVFVRGETGDALPLYGQAQIYCLPSCVEGFPNTVLEAMSAGLPCVAFQECEGARALIGEEGGLLAEAMTEASLASCLRRLMASGELREAMGRAALQRAAAYAPETIFDQWEALFAEAAERKGRTVMDSFQEEPFAGRSRLSAAARREWLFRNFGMPMPHSFAWWRQRVAALSRAAARNGKLIVRLPVHFWRAFSLFWSKDFAYKQYVFRQLHKTVRMLPKQNSRRTASFIAYICKKIDVENASVCCIGCRDEQELAEWKKLNIKNVLGIDIISTDKDIYIMDMHATSFADNSFDIIYACHSLEHAAYPHAAVDEFVRIVKNNGNIAIEVPTNFIANNVDINMFSSISELHGLFKNHNVSVVSEDFIMQSDNTDTTRGGCVFRSIYIIKKI